MKIFHTVCRASIPLLAACALVFALKPIPVFAQDGQESLEIARQREQLDALYRNGDLFEHAVIVEGLVYQAGESFYRFLALDEPEDARRGEEIAKELKGRIKHIRGFIQKDYQVQLALDELEKDLAKYTSEFDALFEARKDFSTQYRDGVFPLIHQLESQESSLAKTAAATGNTDLCHMLVSYAQSIGKIRAAVSASFYSEEQRESQRVRAYMEGYWSALSRLKEAATLEMQTVLGEAEGTMKNLKDAFDSFDTLGRSVAMHSSTINECLGAMKACSRELCNVLQARHRAALQNVGRKMF